MRLADCLTVVPGMLTGSPTELDVPVGLAYTCRSCFARRPARVFLPVKGSPYVYLRCRICRAKRAKERYHSDPEERAAQKERVRRNRQKRKQAWLSSLTTARG